MNEKEMYLDSWEQEFQTTLKVLKAYPSDKLDIKPHEVSRTTRDPAWNFVMEEKLIGDAIKGEIVFATPPPAPKELHEITKAYEESHKELIIKVKNLPETEFNSMIKFPTGPKQMTDVRKADVCWMMLRDMIHHRGQLSVYLRMAGGKVPSIYGPSYDEPWM